MAVERLRVIVWFFVAILVSGLCMIFAGKALQVPLALVHKLLAVLCLVLLVRNVGALRAFTTQPALQAAIIVFALAFLGAFAAGVIQSIPACAGSVWLNLHRVAAATAAIACVVAARLAAVAARTGS